MSDKKNKNVNSAVVEEEVQKPTRAEKKAAKKAAKERLKKVLAARKNGEKLIADNYNGTSMIQTVNLKKKFDDQEREAMRMYRIQGMTIREIADRFECSVGIVHKIINEK